MVYLAIVKIALKGRLILELSSVKGDKKYGDTYTIGRLTGTNKVKMGRNELPRVIIRA